MSKETTQPLDELYPLIDRLEKACKIKHPNRPWPREFYYDCAWAWRDKIPELKEQVKRLESEVMEVD